MPLTKIEAENLTVFEDITWLAGPLAELKAILLQVRKIWGVEVAVLNEKM